MENVIIKYSDFFDDDGGMSKVVQDFTNTGNLLIAEAKKLKKELADSFTLENPEALAKYEAQVGKLTKVNEAYEKAKKDLVEIEKQYAQAVKNSTDQDIKAERVKGAKADATRKELQAERELERGIQQSLVTKKQEIALSEAQRKQRDIAEKSIRKEKDAYGEMSAELNKLFRASASVAVQMFKMEEAGQKNTPAYARLSSEFGVLQGRTVKLDKALKEIDKSLGRNQRNVGNYQFDALGNSIQQVLRETPSAAVSLNTFFLAISNNLPALFDSLTAVSSELKELKNIALEATEQLSAQTAIQQTAKQVSDEATEALSQQVEGVLASVSASREQALAIREQVSAHVAEIETTGTASAVTIQNTESVLLNAGATIDQTAALQRQIVATGEAVVTTTAATSAENALTASVARANTALSAQPTLLQRVSSSLFSLNTAFTLGVLVLTLWGGKLVDMVGELFNFDESLKSVTESQKALAGAQLEGLKATVADERALRSNLKIAKDRNLLDDEREIALKNLRSQYPFYFKDLTDEQILLGKTAKAEAEVIKALNKRAEAQKANEQVIKNRQRILEIADEEAKKAEELNKAQLKFNELSSRTSAPSDAENAAEREGLALGKVRNIQEEIQKLKAEETLLNKENLGYEAKILSLQKQSIGLDYKQEKAKRDKLVQQIKSVDYLASEFELMKTILDNAIQNNREIYESDRYTVEQRLAARAKFLEQSTTLAEVENRETLRLLDKKYKEESKAMVKSADGQTKIMKYSQNGLRELKKQYDFDVEKAEEDHQQKLRNIQKESGEVAKLQQLQFQLEKLESDRQYFSTSSAMYDDYTKQIADIQNKINKIVDPLKGLELSDQVGISDAELTRIKELRGELTKILDGRQLSELNPFERKSLLKQIEKFEKDRTRIESNYDTQRKMFRVKSIEDEQERYNSDTNEFKELEIERQSILLDLENKGIDDMLKAQKDKADKFKDFLSEVNTIVGAVLDRMIEITQKRVQQSEKLIDDQAKKVDDQVTRAQNGLTNTLKFEQEQLGKREAELVKQQKREERLQKIKALYNSYAGYADKDPDTAIVKALRDFAILESITASFGDGGIVEDRLPSDGIFRGQSHKGNQKGIPIRVEGKEGIFSTNEMKNLGKDNFYKMKKIAGMGQVDENFFSRQRQNFIQTVPVPISNDEVVKELKDVKRAIENQPVPNWKVDEVANGTMKLVEEIQTKNKTVRNTYIVKKPRP